ncbi:hypothetical protein HYU45_00865 [Candidatus Daviesbacteria bacterium]|nr:hypothetical protein [Candidatus Daviesbacteria bacterium]
MKILFTSLTLLFIIFFINPASVFATGSLGENSRCYYPAISNGGCNEDLGLFCEPSQDDSTRGVCKKSTVKQIFGTITAPSPLAGFLAKDPTGTGGAISQFLSNLVALFYSLAAIVALFMFLWAAFEWMTSGGEKEKVASARNKIIYTIIGIILLALAFAIIRIVGQFTGFTFFKGA